MKDDKPQLQPQSTQQTFSCTQYTVVCWAVHTAAPFDVGLQNHHTSTLRNGAAIPSGSTDQPCATWHSGTNDCAVLRQHAQERCTCTMRRYTTQHGRQYTVRYAQKYGT